MSDSEFESCGEEISNDVESNTSDNGATREDNELGQSDDEESMSDNGSTREYNELGESDDAESFNNSEDEYNTNNSILEENRVDNKEESEYEIIKMYKLREFIQIDSYNHNNTLNKEHIIKLKEDFENNKSGYITGIFSVIEFKDGCIILIDGHHRIKALKELYLEENFDTDFMFYVAIYKLDIKYSQEDENVLDIFSKVNNTKPFKTDIEVTKANINITSRLKSRYPKLFSKTQEEKRNRFPNLNEKGFCRHLGKILEEKEVINENELFKKIIDYNKKMKRDPTKYLKKAYLNKSSDFYTEKNKQLTTNKCFLGIKSSDTDFKWLTKIL